MILLAKSGEGVVGCQSGKMARTGRGERDATDPANQTDEVDGGGSCLMLQGRFGRADLARTSQAEAADCLRDRCLDTRRRGVERGKHRLPLALTRHGQG